MKDTLQYLAMRMRLLIAGIAILSASSCSHREVLYRDSSFDAHEVLGTRTAYAFVDSPLVAGSFWVYSHVRSGGRFSLPEKFYIYLERYLTGDTHLYAGDHQTRLHFVDLSTVPGIDNVTDEIDFSTVLSEGIIVPSIPSSLASLLTDAGVDYLIFIWSFRYSAQAVDLQRQYKTGMGTYSFISLPGEEVRVSALAFVWSIQPRSALWYGRVGSKVKYEKRGVGAVAEKRLDQLARAFVRDLRSALRGDTGGRQLR